MGKGTKAEAPGMAAGVAGMEGEAEAQASGLRKCSSFVENLLGGLFDKLGGFAARRPFVTICVSVLFCLACMSGFAVMESENRGDKLWVPQDTLGQEQADYMRDTYGSQPRKEEFVTVANMAGAALSKPVLLEVMRLYEVMLQVTAEGGETLAKKVITAEQAAPLTPAAYNLTSLCISRGGACWGMSILSLWCHDRAVLAADPDVLATINRYDAGSYTANQAGGCAPAPLNTADVVGGLVRNSAGQIVSGDAIYGVYWLENNGELEKGRMVDPKAEAFEFNLLKAFESFTSTDFRLSYQATRSRNDAFGGAIRGDIGLVSGGYFLIIGYAVFSLGRCNAVESRALLTLAAVAAVGLAIGASMGLAALFGQFYGPVHSVLPFLLLGLGIDDAFVIANQFALECGEQYPLGSIERKKLASRSIEDQLRAAMRHAGVSVTVTSLTDMVAFAIGTSTVLPALSSFCAYAACGILLLYVLMSTFFAASVGLDARRQRAFRRECCCCCSSARHREAAEAAEAAVNPSAASATPEPIKDSAGPMRRYFEKLHAPFLLKAPVQISVIVVFIGMLVVGIVGATKLKMDFRYEWFYPDDSYLQSFIKDRETHFVQMTDYPVQLVFNAPLDYSANSANLISLQNSMQTIPELDGVTVTSWYAAYTTSNGTVPATAAEFITSVHNWIHGPGSTYKRDIVWGAGNASILSSRFHYKYDAAQMISAKDKVNAMKGLQEEVMAILPDGVSAFPFTFAHVFFEQFEVIDREMWINLGLALGAVFVITLVLIGHPGTSSLVFLAVAMTLVDVLGMMWIWEISIDSVAVINLTLAIGLAVDYSAHIGHNFMTQQGTKPERVVKALADMGTSVFNGGFSTFLAVVVLALSNSYVFRVFFKMFFGISVFGLAHGLIFLPVMLALVGPEPYLGENGRPASRPSTPSSINVKEKAPSKEVMP